MVSALVTEVVMTMMFLIIIVGATDERAPAGLAPIAIGLGLTLIYLISIPVTNASVNPARSTGVAVYVGDWAVAQFWLFWVALIVGGAIGALIYRSLFSDKSQSASQLSLEVMGAGKPCQWGTLLTIPVSSERLPVGGCSFGLAATDREGKR